MAKTAAEKCWKITVENNSNYCGVDAGGVQFANGTAICHSARIADWFSEHPGYKVEEIKAAKADAE